MNRRIVVRLREEAAPELDTVARRLSDSMGMRVGATFPRSAQLVGEVRGEVEADRISALPEVAHVRTQSVNPGRMRRSG